MSDERKRKSAAIFVRVFQHHTRSTQKLLRAPTERVFLLLVLAPFYR